MPFAYYDRLSPELQEAYRRSDAERAIRLYSPSALAPLAASLAEALASEDPGRVEASLVALCGAVCRRLGVPEVEIEVLEVRPRFVGAELHGLYTRRPLAPPTLYVWMRTARQTRVVAFRTFLRTVLHELLHHLDFELYGLPASLHTEGFFKRESSLFHQLVPEARARATGSAEEGPSRRR